MTGRCRGGVATTTTDTTRTTGAAGPGRGRGGRGRVPADRMEREREARLVAVHEQLAVAVAAAASDAGWRAWLEAAARFREYSPTNQLLIALQRPGATRVAGYRAWQGLGRQVHKGERGITVLAPVRRRVEAADTDSTGPVSGAAGDQPPATTTIAGGAGVGESGAGPVVRRVVGWTTATVFDLAQTDGDPLPEPPAALLTPGGAPAGLWEALVGLVEQAGYGVGRAGTAPAYGVTRYDTHRVELAPDLDGAAACHVLAHELGHIAAGHETRREVPLGVREAEADGVAHLLSTATGIPGTFTVDYVTGWTGGDADLVRATQARVVTTAAGLLARLDPALVVEDARPTRTAAPDSAGNPVDRLDEVGAGAGAGVAVAVGGGGAR